MAKLFDKFLGYIGIEEDPEYEGDNYHEDYFDNSGNTAPEHQDNILPLGGRGRKRNANVVNFPNAAQLKMIVYHPISYEDTQNIIDNLKSNKPVIVNMEDLEVDSAQRILDFIAGAVYALNATIYKVARGIFVVAPNNYDVIGNTEGGSPDGE